MDTLGELQQLVVKFMDKRNWKQFHNPKDSSLSLILEVAELLEHFQWRTKDKVAEELVDVLYWVLR